MAAVSLAVSSLLAGCDRIPGTDQHLIAQAEKRAADSLRDPKSAQFKDVRVTTSAAGKMVCGLVNGRNGFGGYADFTRFVATAKEAALDEGATAAPEKPVGGRMDMMGERNDFDDVWRGAGCTAPSPGG